MISIGILVTVFSGIIYGYVQANRMSEWSSMSLAAQSYASEGAEQVRAGNWSPRAWPPVDQTSLTNYSFKDIMDVPIKGDPTNTDFSFFVTNYIAVTSYSANPPVRQIRCDCVWIFPLTGKLQTNTVILLRAGDQ
ncbi:MAG: hypothetical protein WCK57_08510 [Verrucomicrobiae bacterium]